jgi:hypothetical protein
MIDPKTTGKIIDEASKIVPEIYKDLAKPATQEVGSVAGRSVKALLSPVRAFLWGWEKIEKIVEEGINKRFEKIPEENRKTPDPEIAVPLMQALTYTAQNETLREMYLNLLANAMDSSKDKKVHPSFVELIKQMNSLDAKVFDKLSKTLRYQKALNPYIGIKGTNQTYIAATPEWFLGWTIIDYNVFDVSSSIVRLSKFGLVELLLDRTAGKDGYDELKNHKDLKVILTQYENANPQKELEIRGNESILYINEYGKQFLNACC